MLRVAIAQDGEFLDSLTVAFSSPPGIGFLVRYFVTLKSIVMCTQYVVKHNLVLDGIQMLLNVNLNYMFRPQSFGHHQVV